MKNWSKSEKKAITTALKEISKIRKSIYNAVSNPYIRDEFVNYIDHAVDSLKYHVKREETIEKNQKQKVTYRILVNSKVVGKYKSKVDCLTAALGLRIQAAQPQYEGMELVAAGNWDENNWPSDNTLRFTFK